MPCRGLLDFFNDINCIKRLGTAARVVAKKVALDISVFAFPYYSAFYICLNSLAGISLSESKLELKQKMIPTIATTTAFWVPAQTLNFR